MRELILFITIGLFIMLIIIYPFKVKFAMHFNVFEAVGFISLRSLCFKLFSAKIVLNEAGEIDLIRGKKKLKKKKKPLSLLSVYFLTLAKRLAVKKFEWYFTCGSDKNADTVSLICGYVLSLDAVISSILLNKYSHVKIYKDIDPIFDKERLEVASSVVVSFCLFDMFISVFTAYKNYFKLKQKREI